MANIIFDFDGTIADSLPLAMDLFYGWAKIEPFPPDKVQRLRNMTLKDVIRTVGIPLWRVPSLLVQARTQFGKRLTEVSVFDGIPQVLDQLHSRGHKLFVMSSNSPQNIRKFLKSQGINQYFDGIHGNTGLFGKTTALKHIIRRYKLSAKETYAIGDETRDIDAAKKAKIVSIAVNWGYNADKILKAHKPDYLVSKPSQLLELLQ